jgi:hypothetical protein
MRNSIRVHEATRQLDGYDVVIPLLVQLVRNFGVTLISMCMCTMYEMSGYRCS